jgi:NADH oxidase (H2O2-forming)
MDKFDIVVIGGGPSGQIVANTAKGQYPDKSVAIITEKKEGLVPCGIPYIFNDLGSCENNYNDATGIESIGGKLIIDRIESIDSESKTVKTKSSKTVSYDKLVLATGSSPVIPTFIKGVELDGVFTVAKDYQSMEALKKRVDESETVNIIGAGFIGCEVAEQIKKAGKTVHLVEALPQILGKSFSEKVGEQAEDALADMGVNIHTGSKVIEIKGENGAVESIVFEDGKTIKTDLVIMSIGYKPNINLAESAGISLNRYGFIRVDKYMRSSVKDIYAIGDCSSTSGFITGNTDNIMLASTGTAEARILGYNIYSLNLLRNFGGTLGIFSTKLNGVTFSCAGANEKTASDANLDYVVGEFSGIDRHPGKFTDTSKVHIKLLASPASGVIIGAEIWGSQSASELINIVGMAIQNEVTVFDLLTYQIGTHPLLTGPPTGYAIIKSAEGIFKQIS